MIRLASGLVIVLIVLTWFPMTVIATPDTLDYTLELYFDESWTHYHSYEEIVLGILTLESSGIAKVVDIGESVEGQTIWAIKISDDPNIEDEQENEILFVGLHHAREWISAEVPYYLAVKFVEEYGVNSTVKNLIDNSELWIVPVLNPDGLEYSRSQVFDLESENNNSRFWRKNRAVNSDGSHGVDLNRNYGTTSWGEDIAEGCWDGCDHPNHEPYWGPSAFSEPETCAIRDLVLDDSRDFIGALSYHSYGQLIGYPWGNTSDPIPEANMMNTIGQEMSDLIKDVHGRHYEVLQAGNWYVTVGDMVDWVYEACRIPAYTIELRPGNEDYDPVYFELSDNEILGTCEENWPAAFHFINEVIGMEDSTGILPESWLLIIIGTPILIVLVVIIAAKKIRTNYV
ncbi:MAG: hypothetical protein AM326_11295 [Candidatus Thorarchaeota archaeon SMTZ-45]|nr:MAG: hypothetical protein AM326_11295 [Candidatus Thorarchaeota archaeon SMTZ-45]KXH74995.1 MAG: hypothetical protein AM325_11715 [Candidatus Thorarchaeota archaeon SMTZ1-45]